MRILIKFKNKNKPNYRQVQLQGLVYSLIREAGFSSIHDTPQFKPRFFNFSQLFLDKDERLTFIICSPINELINSLFEVLKNNPELKINNENLIIEEVKRFTPKLKKPIILKTETPIIVRVPKEKYKYYQIKLEKEYSYFYWRPLKGIPFEPFIKQLEDRVWKMYKLFTGQNFEEKKIFTKFFYKKTVDLPFFKGNKKFSRIGTLWEFELDSKIDDSLIKFILDTGLGELNSQGYGFVNVKNK
jgi:CRISPR-associated endoribonuclease Cas6